MNDAAAWAIALPAAYLIGSVPTGVLLGRLVRGVDVRKYGSGNTGATNVWRTLGPIAAVGVLALDWGKGAAAVFIARAVSDSPVLTAAAALAALSGHVWPVFSKFQGGKGVAAGLGGLTIISPLAAAVTLLGLAVAVATRYVSLGSMVGTATGLIALVVLVAAGRLDEAYLIFAVAGFLIIELRHRANLVRLFKGTENRLRATARPRRATTRQV